MAETAPRRQEEPGGEAGLGQTGLLGRFLIIKLKNRANCVCGGQNILVNLFQTPEFTFFFVLSSSWGPS